VGITFNADEVFEMAEQIERNGAKFYRQAAGNCPDAETKKMLFDMAAMEDEHLKTFQLMRRELSGREKEMTTFDPDNEAAMYLQAVGDSRGWEGKISPALELTGDDSIKQVLRAAVDAEKNSVVFYVALKEMVPARAGKDKVDDIIREEVGHLRLLYDRLSNLKD